MTDRTTAVYCVNANLRRIEGKPFVLDRTFRTEAAAHIYVDQMKSMTGNNVLFRVENYNCHHKDVPHQL